MAFARGNANNPPPPSPWLKPENPPKPDSGASFVEYLRWMRPPDAEYKDATKVQILQMAEEKAKNYSQRLTELTNRTRLIAGEGNTFQVKCTWRVRVGGHRGPESILLPAFDALGMPYIPSSTLRGLARNQAIREIIRQEKLSWKEAEKRVAPWFGSLEAKNPSNRAGKVVFLDAYPLPSQAGVLALDMANNIWKWNGDSPEYKPNPNPFFSLKEATFLIGLRLATGCQDTAVLERVRNWLSAGLQSGTGSQVNTGYGQLIRAGEADQSPKILEVEFILTGQLIHGCQKFANASQPYQKDQDGNLKTDRNGNLKPDTRPEAEVRPVAFKSALRYWFRAFALGVLPAKDVHETWEAVLFGSIQPQKRGWVRFQVVEGRKPRSSVQDPNAPCLQQEGVLALTYSSEAPEANKPAIAKLFKNLTWMMFHLGGVGQGARRPCYSRKNRPHAPWYRGATLKADSDDSFWQLPASPQEFMSLFRQRLGDFYAALADITGVRLNPRAPLAVGAVTEKQWRDAVDANCRIVACAGKEDFGKPFALAVLHSRELKIRRTNRREQTEEIYNTNLCGSSGTPSPVWVADFGPYQVVTVFGCTGTPRQNYLKKLRTEATTCSEIWPLQ